MQLSRSLVVLVAVCVLAGGFVTACASLSGQSQAQLAYNACRDLHNSKRQNLDVPWAVVSGVGEFSQGCYWWEGASSLQSSVNQAVEACRNEYSDCFVFSTSDGLSAWSQEISDQGGVSEGGWSLADFLNVGAAGVNLYNAYSSGGDDGYVAPPPSSTAPSASYSGGNMTDASCGRHYVGLIPQSICRAGGNIPDSSISSDEDPDPVANCWTPPC